MIYLQGLEGGSQEDVQLVGSALPHSLLPVRLTRKLGRAGYLLGPPRRLRAI